MAEEAKTENLMLSTERLISLLQQKINDVKSSDHIIGELILKMKTLESHKDMGFNSFAKFLKTKFDINTRTANRYINKYRLMKIFPEHSDGISAASANICDIIYMTYVFSGKDGIAEIVSMLPYVSIKEANSLYSESAKADKEIRTNRIVLSLSMLEMAEIEDAEETIMQAFDLKSRKDVFLNAVRSLKAEADAVVANQ